MSERKACSLINLSRSCFTYVHKERDDDKLIGKLKELASRYIYYGFRKLFAILRRLGFKDNHKRVHRIYRELGLNKRRRPKKRIPCRNPEPLKVPDNLNGSWSIDFVSDSLTSGRKFRTFNVIDDYSRECLGVEIDFSLPSERIVRCLDNIAMWQGCYPKQIRCDNGPELISNNLAFWAREHNVKINFITPGKPSQNGFVERFNGTYRNEVLDIYLFSSLKEVRQITERWMDEYNTERPHESLGDLTPAEYREQWLNNQALPA